MEGELILEKLGICGHGLGHDNIHWRAFVNMEMNFLVLYTAGNLLTGCVGFEILLMVFTKISSF
jgi:hypothetical protein